jgi:pimeloyl-ACP methyl ester carboxylesterase
MLVLAVLLAGVLSWRILGNWIPGGSERFYLLFPPVAVALFLTGVPDGWTKLRAQLRPALVYVAILGILCTLYNLWLTAGLNGTNDVVRWVLIKQIFVAIYFFAAVSLLVMLPLRGLRYAACKLDERCFGPLEKAQAGRLPRTLAREVLPAVLTIPLLLPYFMGVTYVHRFKAPNTTNPREVLGREYEDVAFTTRDGLTISGWFIPGKVIVPAGLDGYPVDPAGLRPSRTLIICHGLGANRSNFLQYVEVGDALGANVLMFDFRGHGDSDGYTITFGNKERLDVLAAVDYLRNQRPEQAKQIYGLGISMGSSALIQGAAEAQPAFHGVIVDSAFASAIELTDNILVDFPPALRPIVSECGVPIASLHAGCRLSDVRPIDCVDHLRAPLLLIHARDDGLIPVDHSKRLCERAQEPKALLITDTGNHGSSWTDKKRYLQFVRTIETMRGSETLLCFLSARYAPSAARQSRNGFNPNASYADFARTL